MTDVRRADPAFRRKVVLVLAVGTIAGAMAIAGFEQYDAALRGWIQSEPGAFAQRVNVVLVILAVALIAPLLALAAYLWSLGGKIVLAQEFPLPGTRVIRDTPVVNGERALSRGRLFKALALGCGISSVALGWLLWWLASLLGGHTS